jgi:WD40 repeat protein
MLNTVYVLVGMPGVGKSTWINKNYPHLPVVSSDNFIELMARRTRIRHIMRFFNSTSNPPRIWYGMTLIDMWRMVLLSSSIRPICVPESAGRFFRKFPLIGTVSLWYSNSPRKISFLSDLLRDRIRLFRRTCSLRWLTVMSDPTALMGLTKSAM